MPEKIAERVGSRAAALLGASVDHWAPARSGGTIASIASVPGGRDYALKTYLRQPGDARDRIRTEFDGLTFLAAAGCRRVPRSVARDADVALYEWIEGTAPGVIGATDIDEALAFLGELHALRGSPAAVDLPLASEACLSPDEILRQIDRRRQDLAAVGDGALADLLGGAVASVRLAVEDWGRRRCLALGVDFMMDAPPEGLTLSPSDFGFHNAIRRPEGRLVFIDFEYFGWDDPAKLVSDFLLHPGMSLDADLRRRFYLGAAALYGEIPGFAARVEVYYPLIALRWCIILLNEFLPERWARRAFAGADDWAAAKRRQLDVARRRLNDIVKHCRDHPA